MIEKKKLMESFENIMFVKLNKRRETIKLCLYEKNDGLYSKKRWLNVIVLFYSYYYECHKNIVKRKIDDILTTWSS